MASYMLGYGTAAYGIGKIIELTHSSLGGWYLNSTVVALGVVLLSFTLTQKTPSEAGQKKILPFKPSCYTLVQLIISCHSLK